MGIYDVVNDQDVAMHYRAISNTVSHLEVFDVSKAKGWSDFLSYVLEVKIFQYGFLEEHNVRKNSLLIANTEKCSRHHGD